MGKVQRALVRLLWRSIADNAECTCADGDPCPECEAMQALNKGRWHGAEWAAKSLPKIRRPRIRRAA